MLILSGKWDAVNLVILCLQMERESEFLVKTLLDIPIPIVRKRADLIRAKNF